MDLKNYDEIVSIASQILVQALLSNEKNLDSRTLTIDADVAEVMRELGMEITTKISVVSQR